MSTSRPITLTRSYGYVFRSNGTLSTAAKYLGTDRPRRFQTFVSAETVSSSDLSRSSVTVLSCQTTTRADGARVTRTEYRTSDGVTYFWNDVIEYSPVRTF